MYTGPSKKVIVITLPKLIVFQGLKYNTIGNAIGGDNINSNNNSSINRRDKDNEFIGILRLHDLIQAGLS